MKKIKILILTLKNSKKLKYLKKRLKDIKINYHILYGIDGTKIRNHNFLLKNYNDINATKFIGRSLKPPEIATSIAHINAYKYIVKKKISTAIIMEDDAYPSIYLKKWIDSNCVVPNNMILSFYSYPSGYLYKSYKKTFVDEKIKIHLAKTHIYNASCYQINISTCKKIIKLVEPEIIGFCDWPFLIKKNNICLATTVPYLTVMDKFNNSYIKKFRVYDKNFILSFFKNLLPSYFINFLRIFFYASYLGYIFGENKKSRIYYEFFFYKNLIGFLNFFQKKYLDTQKMYFNKKFYAEDLHKELKIMKKYSKKK